MRSPPCWQWRQNWWPSRGCSCSGGVPPATPRARKWGRGHPGARSYGWSAATSGSGGSKGRPTVPAAPAPAPNPFAEPEWVAFLGVAPPTDLPPVPDVAAGTARTMAGNVDVGAVVRSALEALTNHE